MDKKDMQYLKEELVAIQGKVARLYDFINNYEEGCRCSFKDEIKDPLYYQNYKCPECGLNWYKSPKFNNWRLSIYQNGKILTSNEKKEGNY